MGRSGYDTSGLGTSAKPSRAAHKATGAGEDGSGAKGKKAGASKRKPDGAARVDSNGGSKKAKTNGAAGSSIVSK